MYSSIVSGTLGLTLMVFCYKKNLEKNLENIKIKKLLNEIYSTNKLLNEMYSPNNYIIKFYYK